MQTLNLSLKSSWTEKLFAYDYLEIFNIFPFYDEKNNLALTAVNNLRNVLYINQDIIFVSNPAIQDMKYFIYSFSPISAKRLLYAFKTWAETSLKGTSKNVNKEHAIKEFINNISIESIPDPKEIIVSITTDNGGFSFNDFGISEFYKLLPRLVMWKIATSEYSCHLYNIPINFKYIGESSDNLCRLISSPAPFKKSTSGEYCSVSLDISMNIVPGENAPSIMISPELVRWCRNDLKYAKHGFEHAISVYMDVSDNKMIRIQLKKNQHSDDEDGDNFKFEYFSDKMELLKRIYPEIKNLPSPDELFANPASFENLHVAYSIGMGKGITTIKGGIGAIGKSEIFENISEILKDIATSHRPYLQVNSRKEGILLSAINKNSRNNFNINNSFFKKSLDNILKKGKVNFYVYWSGDESEKEIVESIKLEIKVLFSSDTTYEKLITVKDVRCYDILKPIGKDINISGIEDKDNASVTYTSEYNRVVQNRINNISSVVTFDNEAHNISIILLKYLDSNGKSIYKKGVKHKNLDPKEAIRHAFALNGSLTQFIDPKTPCQIDKIKNTIFDACRQLGIFYLPDNLKTDLFNRTVMGISCIKMCDSMWKLNGKFIRTPRILTYVKLDASEGQITVKCPQLWKGEISYYKACINIGKIMAKPDFKITKIEAFPNAIKGLVVESKDIVDGDSILMVKYDRDIRLDWAFIQDKNLMNNDLSSVWGRSKEDVWYNPKNTSMRIFRVRNDENVPSYYFYITGKRRLHSGVFKNEDGKVCYISPVENMNDLAFRAENDKTYGLNRDFKMRHLVEIYPLLLCEGDNIDMWSSLIAGYTSCYPEYLRGLEFPLPIHLANSLREYIGKKK